MPKLWHAVSGDNQIREAIVVEVTNSDTVAVKRLGMKARLLENVLKCLAASVLKQCTGQTSDLVLLRNNSTSGSHEIEPPIPIKIKPANASAERFEERAVVLLFAISIRCNNTQLFGTLHKRDAFVDISDCVTRKRILCGSDNGFPVASTGTKKYRHDEPTVSKPQQGSFSSIATVHLVHVRSL